MADAPLNPADLDFVIARPSTEPRVRHRQEYDLYVPAPEAPVPVVVLVHGPNRDAGARHRDWPVYRGYASLITKAGFAAAVVDLDYTDVHALAGPTAQLDRVVEAARSEDVVRADRVLLWAFSGGGRLVGRWLEEPPSWIQGVALTYPVAPAVSRVRTPIVLTRVGLERPAIQATVDRLVAVAPHAEVINVNAGHHGFDFLDHNDESRRAVTAAVAAVVRLLS